MRTIVGARFLAPSLFGFWFSCSLSVTFPLSLYGSHYVSLSFCVVSIFIFKCFCQCLSFFVLFLLLSLLTCSLFLSLYLCLFMFPGSFVLFSFFSFVFSSGHLPLPSSRVLSPAQTCFISLSSLPFTPFFLFLSLSLSFSPSLSYLSDSPFLSFSLSFFLACFLWFFLSSFISSFRSLFLSPILHPTK